MSRILIAGAGSIGTVVGAFLAKDHEVILLRRHEPYPSLPIKIVGVEETSAVVPVENLENLPRNLSLDVIIITCQSQQTDELVRSLNRHITNSPLIISLQNGVGNYETIRSKFKENPIILGTVWWSATQIDKTKVYYHRKASTILGRIEEDEKTHDSHVIKAEKLLAKYFQVKRSDDINLEIHRKLALNVVSPVLALVKQPYPQGFIDEGPRKLAHAMFDEAVNAMLPKYELLVDEKLLNVHSLLKGDLPITSDEAPLYRHKVSSQISLEKYGGAKSNVEALLLPIIRLAKITQSRTPTIQKVLDYTVRLTPDYKRHSSSDLESLIVSWNGCSLIVE